MDEDFEVILNALLMLTGIRPPIVVKDVPTTMPTVRVHLPVLSAGDYDLEYRIERMEWQDSDCDPNSEYPYYVNEYPYYVDESLWVDEMGSVVRLIPDDGKPWADALKAIVADAFSRQLDEWAQRRGFIGCTRQSG